MATQTSIPPSPTWDLESIFPGGSNSKQFAEFREQIKREISALSTLQPTLPATLSPASQSGWIEFIERWQELGRRIETTVSFAGCLISQNVDDTTGQAIAGEGDLFNAQWLTLKAGLETWAVKQTDAAWNELVGSPALAPVRFFLDELRQLGRAKMPYEQEALALSLAVNGYHAWNRLYDKMAGDLRAPFTVDGQTKTLSLGQLATYMGNEDRALRKQAFDQMVAAWQSRADLASIAINAIGGYRLTLYEKRGWASFLKEPLDNFRLSQAALDAMWSVIQKETPKLAPYLDAKKKLLGIDAFRWYDEFAPCGRSDKKFPFDEAGDFIVDNVGAFSPDLAKFCRMALDKRWIEAEDRAGKAGGGFCTGFHTVGQTRIFMTYGGTYENLLTLAHELGHSYHSFVLNNVPFFCSWYPSTLAETASIFNELLVTDAALKQGEDAGVRLMLLEQKLQQTYIMFCNIQCRYLFDIAFYTERKNGMVPKDRLSELMVAAQKKAFAGLLDESGYHPLFWCSKLHFYISDNPFYNFPYTFGFLFANGVYARAMAEGKTFAPRYRALLEDTGRMTTDQVALKHLGVDLGKEAFWQEAVALALQPVSEFVKLSGK